MLMSKEQKRCGPKEFLNVFEEMKFPQTSPQRTENYVQTGGVALFQNCRAVATKSLVGESQGGAIFTGSFIQTGLGWDIRGETLHV